ncbi:MAG: prepilin-type N-terminal cleavage/methylation domain-containing protein [Candidatus Saccharimonadales bacterium]
MQNLINRQKGFTLIELLVVIVVIGILVALTLPNLFSAQERARDTEKKNDTRSVSLQLESYWNDNQTYPVDLSALDSYGYNAAEVNEELTYAPLQDDETACTAEPCVAYELIVPLENENDTDVDENGNYVVTSINRPSGAVAQ